MTKPRKTSRDEPQEAGPPASWDGESESFGTWLRRQREVRAIDLRAISQDSKISMTYLQAFERDRFDILPAPVFARGFLRQYAHYVGLDGEEVVNFYEAARRHHEGEEEVVEPELEHPSRDGRKLGALAVAAVLAVLLLLWALTRGFPGGAAPEASGVPGSVSEPDPAAALPVPSSAPENGQDQAGSGITEPRREMPIRVTLDFSGECWIEASVDGVRRVAENKVQGESLILEASAVVELKVGNVDAVEVEVNGRPYDFEDVPGTKVRNRRFDREAVAALTGSSGGRG